MQCTAVVIQFPSPKPKPFSLEGLEAAETIFGAMTANLHDRHGLSYERIAHLVQKNIRRIPRHLVEHVEGLADDFMPILCVGLHIVRRFEAAALGRDGDWHRWMIDSWIDLKD